MTKQIVQTAALNFAFSKAPLRNLRRVLVAYLQGLHGSFPYGKDEYHWEGNKSQQSEITIHTKVPWRPEDSERRPAIVLTRIKMPSNPVGFGAGPNVQEKKLSSGDARKVKFLSGTYMINCISREGDEAEFLAWRTEHFVTEFRTLLTRCGFHHIGEVSMGGVSTAPGELVRSSQPEWMFCPVHIPFTFQYSWDSKYLTPRTVECVKVTLETELGKIIHEFEELYPSDQGA